MSCPIIFCPNGHCSPARLTIDKDPGPLASQLASQGTTCLCIAAFSSSAVRFPRSHNDRVERRNVKQMQQQQQQCGWIILCRFWIKMNNKAMIYRPILYSGCWTKLFQFICTATAYFVRQEFSSADQYRWRERVPFVKDKYPFIPSPLTISDSVIPHN